MWELTLTLDTKVVCDYNNSSENMQLLSK